MDDTITYSGIGAFVWYWVAKLTFQGLPSQAGKEIFRFKGYYACVPSHVVAMPIIRGKE